MELSSLHALIEDALDAFTGGWIERLYFFGRKYCSCS